MSSLAPTSARGIVQRLSSSQGLIDAAFVVGLGVLGLLGFGAVYGGTSYLLVGLVGLVLGVAVAELARWWHKPVLAEVFVALVAFLLLGGAVAAPASALGGLIPTLGTLSALGHVGVYGWKELLTTAPPVGDSSDLLALPYIVGLIGGVAGQSAARRSRSAGWPLAGPVGILALGILFGAPHPVSLLAQGSGFAALALGWATLRYHRNRRVGVRRSVNTFRAASAVALLAVAGLIAVAVGPHLPGSARKRVVLSSYVVPPFEANRYPSPLSEFRRYVPGGPASTGVLFTVTGAKAGSLVQIATMDTYDGVVWGFAAGSTSQASNNSADAFRRFGSTLPAGSPGTAETVNVRIGTLGGVWLPDISQATGIVFRGPAAATLASNFRYDTATGTAAEQVALQPGDAYTLHAIVPAQPTAKQLSAAASGDVTVAVTGVPAVVGTDANKWSSGASGAWGKVMAIASHLLRDGYFSNGSDPTAGANAPVLSAPGHGAGRLITFLEGGGLVGTHIVGDDEQYAAAFALMANAVGVPARVVLGAQVGSGGIVTGSDVHAWVEVSLAGLGWVPVSWQAFTPTRPAHEVPPTQQPQAASSNPVEPPVVSAVHPPLGAQANGSTANAASQFFHPRPAASHLPAWLIPLLASLLGPALVVGAVLGAIGGLKRRRRQRRRNARTPAAQIAGGWAELLDQARDHGWAVPANGTRREQAATLQDLDALPLARRADTAVFAPGDPSDSQVADFWAAVDHLVGSLRSNVGWRVRWRGRISLRSLRLAGNVSGVRT